MTSIVHAQSKFSKVPVRPGCSKGIVNQLAKLKARQERSNGRCVTSDRALAV
jgi:hypothetical protein